MKIAALGLEDVDAFWRLRLQLFKELGEVLPTQMFENSKPQQKRTICIIFRKILLVGEPLMIISL